MGYFERVAESAFKETADGLCVYYPNGVLGKGRVVTSPELKKKIFSFHKNTVKFGIPLCIAAGLFLKLQLVILLALVILPVFYFYQRKLIGNLPIHNSRISAQEIYNKVKFPAWYRKTILVLGVLGIVFSLFVAIFLGKFYFISITLA